MRIGTIDSKLICCWSLTAFHPCNLELRNPPPTVCHRILSWCGNSIVCWEKNQTQDQSTFYEDTNCTLIFSPSINFSINIQFKWFEWKSTQKEIQFALMSCGFMCISFRFNQTFSAHIEKYTMEWRASYIVRSAQGSARFISSRCCCLTCVANINVSHDASVCECLRKDTEQKWCANWSWSWSWKSESVNRSFWIGYAIHSKYYSMLSFFQSNLFSIYVLSTSFSCSLSAEQRDDMS